MHAVFTLCYHEPGTASASATVALFLRAGHAPSAAIVVIFTRRFSAAVMYIMLAVFYRSCRVPCWMVSDRSQQKVVGLTVCVFVSLVIQVAL